jgi:hypothetical protein
MLSLAGNIVGLCCYRTEATYNYVVKLWKVLPLPCFQMVEYVALTVLSHDGIATLAVLADVRIS